MCEQSVAQKGDNTGIDLINSFSLGQNGRHFADDIFKRISWLKISESRFNFHWNLFLRVQLTMKSALVQVMACRLFGAKPLPEPMLTELHTCGTKGRWAEAYAFRVYAARAWCCMREATTPGILLQLNVILMTNVSDNGKIVTIRY